MRTRSQTENSSEQAVLSKLDFSEDVGCSLYALGNWRVQYIQLRKQLEKLFDEPLHDNGNSMPSCFQFQGRAREGELTKRIKIYWKTLAYLQSEGVHKQLGMNTKALCYPGIRMR